MSKKKFSDFQQEYFKSVQNKTIMELVSEFRSSPMYSLLMLHTVLQN